MSIAYALMEMYAPLGGGCSRFVEFPPPATVLSGPQVVESSYLFRHANIVAHHLLKSISPQLWMIHVSGQNLYFGL